MGSIERCFVFRWRYVVAVAVQPVLVEPVHPRQRGELEVIDVVPAAGVGAVDTLGLVEPLVVSASALSNESATVPMEGRAPISASRSVNLTEVN